MLTKAWDLVYGRVDDFVQMSYKIWGKSIYFSLTL